MIDRPQDGVGHAPGPLGKLALSAACWVKGSAAGLSELLPHFCTDPVLFSAFFFPVSPTLLPDSLLFAHTLPTIVYLLMLIFGSLMTIDTGLLLFPCSQIWRALDLVLKYLDVQFFWFSDDLTIIMMLVSHLQNGDNNTS